jgi:predicted alpha/beta hydrolase family esterase
LRTTDFDILIVPGLGGSGPDHWQTRWEAKLSTARRIEQADWHRPRLADWTDRIVEAVGQASRPVLLVAHSLGVPAVIHAAPRLTAGQKPGEVRGAFLVTPPSEAAVAELPEIDPAFALYPRDPLPFPSLVIASRNDPFAAYAQTEDLGYALGGQLLDAGEAGHVNAESGHGPWPEGLMSLAGFLRRL